MRFLFDLIGASFVLEPSVKVLKTRARTSENFLLWHRLGDRIGLTGVCVYLIGFVLPLTWDIPLILLGVCGSLALISKSNRPTRSWPPLTLPILIFIASIGLSTLFSENIGRSLQLNTPLLPALLLFFLISQHFEGTRDIRQLSITLSMVGLGVAVTLLLTGWHDVSEKALREVVKNLGIPVLVVPNDVAFLAIIAPLSLALFFHHQQSVIGIVALLSALLSVGAVCVFRSRTAALTIFITLTCAIILMQPKHSELTPCRSNTKH